MYNLLKISLAILLFLCLANMPYGYYQFVRFAAMLVFAILAYDAAERKAGIEVILCIGLALLFQPFVKVALGRTMWNIVDVIVAICLIASVSGAPVKQNKK